MITIRNVGLALALSIALSGCAATPQTPSPVSSSEEQATESFDAPTMESPTEASTPKASPSGPSTEEQTAEMFDGTVYISPDVLTPESPTDFIAITARGTMVRNTFDRRANNWVEEEMHVYTASYQCSFNVDVLVNLEFSQSEAQNQAESYARVLGQLPIAARSKVYELWVHRGDFPAGGGNQSILIHTDLAERDRGYIEELFIHESAHTSLDWQWGGLVLESDWLAASVRDPGFVSSYAQQFPDREDVAESFGAYALWLQAKGKPSLKADAQRIEALIPERLNFFEQLGKQLGFESLACIG
jgi:hypothetical protein